MKGIPRSDGGIEALNIVKKIALAIAVLALSIFLLSADMVLWEGLLE